MCVPRIITSRKVRTPRTNNTAAKITVLNNVVVIAQFSLTSVDFLESDCSSIVPRARDRKYARAGIKALRSPSIRDRLVGESPRTA